jgi:rhodanese-related sulfurtransferase
MNSKPIHSQRVEKLSNGCLQRFPNVPWLSVDEFLRRSEQEDWSIVDVRSQREQAVSIIPGSLGGEEFEVHIEEHKDKHILVYCTAGCRSGAYAHALRDRGFDAFNLRGGVLGWARAGGPFVTLARQPTRHVHVHGNRWSVLPPGYQAVR